MEFAYNRRMVLAFLAKILVHGFKSIVDVNLRITK